MNQGDLYRIFGTATHGEIGAEQRLTNNSDNLEEVATEYAGSEVAIVATGSRYVYDILDVDFIVTLVNLCAKFLVYFRYCDQKGGD